MEVKDLSTENVVSVEKNIQPWGQFGTNGIFAFAKKDTTTREKAEEQKKLRIAGEGAPAHEIHPFMRYTGSPHCTHWGHSKRAPYKSKTRHTCWFVLLFLRPDVHIVTGATAKRVASNTRHSVSKTMRNEKSQVLGKSNNSSLQ